MSECENIHILLNSRQRLAESAIYQGKDYDGTMNVLASQYSRSSDDHANRRAGVFAPTTSDVTRLDGSSVGCRSVAHLAHGGTLLVVCSLQVCSNIQSMNWNWLIKGSWVESSRSFTRGFPVVNRTNRLVLLIVGTYYLADKGMNSTVYSVAR